MTQTSSVVSELTTKIAEHTAIINQYLDKNNLPPISFSIPSQYDILQYPPEIEASRIAVIDAAQELTELYTGPKDSVVSIAYVQSIKPALLRFISYYGIHKLVPPVGSISLDDIAKQIEVGRYVLRHMMHAAISLRLFREDRPGQISHSAATLFLLSSSIASDFAWSVTEHVYPGIYNIAESVEINPECDEPEFSPWMVWKQPKERSWFDWLNSNELRAQRFANVMTASHTVPGTELFHMTQNYNWAAIGDDSLVVDMGGSDGKLGRALLKVAPNLRVVVQDLPHITKLSRDEQRRCVPSVDYNTDEIPNGQWNPSPGAPRLQFMAHNFFNEQPIKNADVFVFRAVLHDWSDKQMTRIMRQLVPAMRSGVKVLILDDILPPVGTFGLSAERNQHAMDLAMLATCAAGSRELSEWKEVIAASDPRFVVTKVITPPGSALGIMEITWQPGTREHEEEPYLMA